MKLSDHVDNIRTLIYKAFNNQFSRLGFGANKMMESDKIPTELHAKRKKIEELIKSHEGETGSYEEAREKALDELTFTLFNRLAAIKVMEAHQLFPPIVTKQAEHGDRSFGHKVWLEQNPTMRDEEMEGLRDYFKYEFNTLGEAIPLFHKNYPYAFLPYVIEFNEVIDAFNKVEQDAQIEDTIWQSDDILGWLYESYNNVKKQAHKDSGDKTEYDKVSLQSQVYTPRWVVEFLVHNSLGKLYLEMYPDSEIKDLYKIANAPKTRVRDIQPLHELKLIDPASGSGNFLLYAFVFFYALYKDQIDNFGADYEEEDIPKLIIENNLHGIDLDDRAIQLAQLGLWIKAKQKNRNIGAIHFNVVSSDFYLPDFDFVYPIFKAGVTDTKQLSIIEEIWTDLQQAHKFGSLVKIEEKLNIKLHGLINQDKVTLFDEQTVVEYERFKKDFFNNLEMAITRFAQGQGSSFLTDKTKDAITFLKLITQKYDVATANPPYTSRGEYGDELKEFIEKSYKQPYDTYINLYACFLQRLHELLIDGGKMAMVTPMTFMFISTFESSRKLILDNYHINIFVQYGFGGMFSVSVDPAFFVLEKVKKDNNTSSFIKLDEYFNDNKKEVFIDCYNDLIENKSNFHNHIFNVDEFLKIKSHPFIYWISNEFREKFSASAFDDNVTVCQGLATADNCRFLRFWWEIENNDSWVRYAKGGTFNKWVGNLWTTVNWKNDGEDIKNFKDENGKVRSRPQNEQFYFKKGITYSASGRGGYAFRLLPENCMFDVGGSSIFPVKSYKNIEYLLALLNSKLVFYIANCLNPTANIQVGDLKKVPFVIPKKENEIIISNLATQNISFSQELLTYNLIEVDFEKSLFEKYNSGNSLNKTLKEFIENKLYKESVILINEHLINVEIYNVYSLSDYDIELVKVNQGIDCALYSASKEAIELFISTFDKELSLSVINHIKETPSLEFAISETVFLESLSKLFNANKSLEDISHEFKLHPIEIWFRYLKNDVIPPKYKNQKGMEFLADLIREILKEDEDGIIPLVPNAGEKVLLDRIEEKFIDKGFSMAQYSAFDGILGRNINEYLNKHFFKAFTDNLNMFSYLPKTPFIWHLTSGPEQGFDCYIIIYKWNRDKLLRIRSVYIENRERALINRQSDLANDTSAKAQNEKDKIYKQLKEIEVFKTKIDALLAEGYNPILDDGVGKNIAPLQKKGMLAYEVLNAGQLKKYLNADW